MSFTAEALQLNHGFSPEIQMEKVTITPDMAKRIMERNTHNRPIREVHVQRIASQLLAGKFQFNAETIKITVNRNVLDGQHRLLAVIRTGRSMETIIVWGVPEEAFSTIDTIRSVRSGSDVLSRMGVSVGRKTVAIALTWLLRWERGVIADYRQPVNRIENSDIEDAWIRHQALQRACERVTRLRSLASPALMGMMYYVISSRDPELADRMANTLESPAGVSVNDPFFRLREYLLSDRVARLEPVMTIALIIKAANAAKAGTVINRLRWASQGDHPEPFPVLTV